MKINLAGKIISDNKKCFIVAEMSANHCQSLKKALRIVQEAKKAGADAIKLQTFKPESLALKNKKDNKSFKRVKTWKKFKSRYDLFKKAYLPWEWHKKIFQEAKKINLPIFSSPFDLQAVDLLEKLNCPAYKIASPEITDSPLIKKVALTRKPIILSLGLAEKKDIDLAVKILKKNKCKNFILLKCLSHYPASPDLLNLKSIQMLKKKYNCEVGFSDHTLGSASSVAAVSLGAKMIEKHIKLKNEKKSLDAFFSLNPEDFKNMVDDIRTAEKAVGVPTFNIDAKTRLALKGRKSIFVCKNIKKGEKITSRNIRMVRPSTGLHPKYYHKILGKFARRKLNYGKPLKLRDLN